MSKLVDDMEKAIDAVKEWKSMPMLKMPKHLAARAWTGRANGWVFIVTSFSIEDQGFPKGSRGYDGTATLYIAGSSTIIRLSRTMAEKACKRAEAMQSS